MAANHPIDALDATFMLNCHDNASIYTFRREEIPGKLIIYKISGATIATQNMLIGEVRFQFISSNQTHISIYTPLSSDQSWDSFTRGVNENFKYLKRLCMAMLEDLTPLHLQKRNETSAKIDHPGKPALSEDEVIYRLALAQLEEHLKEKDKGMTRGEVVVIAKERLNRIIKSTEIKDGKQRLDNARWRKDNMLLDAAQEQLNDWLNLLSP
jgi:hypothetical protein